MAMVVNSSSEPIVRRIPYLDEISCYDAGFFHRSGSRRFNFASGLRFARDMRRRKFDLIVDLRGSFASLLFALVAKSRYRIDRGTYLVLRKLGRTSLASEHEADVNLDILARTGLPIPSREMTLELSQDDINSANFLLGHTDESASPPPIVVIHPGSPGHLKCWPAERYAQLANQLLKEYSVRVVLVGDKGEMQVAQSIMSAIDGRATDLSGRTTLGQLAAVLQRAALFVGNDSGPMHLAAACGTMVIGLFGPTSPQRFGPYGDRCMALRMETDCSPCMRDTCRRSGYRCIDRISVNDVIAAIRQMI
jgi:lipopolysaccharide heptosyltransferase II